MIIRRNHYLILFFCILTEYSVKLSSLNSLVDDQIPEFIPFDRPKVEIHSMVIYQN